MAVTMFNGRPIPNKCPICDDPIKYHEAKAEWRDAVAHFSCVAARNTAGVLQPQEMADKGHRTVDEAIQLPDLIEQLAMDSPMTRAFKRANPRPGTSEWDQKYPAISADIRTFDSGANRDTDDGKLDYEGFLSPIVLQAFAEYMEKNRHLKDGTLRDSDNWQKGIPLDVYMKSMWRHFMDMWLIHRGYNARSDMKEALCGLLFNASGYLHEMLKEERKNK